MNSKVQACVLALGQSAKIQCAGRNTDRRLADYRRADRESAALGGLLPIGIHDTYISQPRRSSVRDRDTADNLS